MATVYTRTHKTLSPDFQSGQASPALLFHKWQAWDDDFKGFQRTESRLEYLQNIATSVQATFQRSYSGWHQRYLAALTALGAETTVRYSTVWRLIIGWGGNPALEAGLTLHHLYGFPCIPGAAVKGVLHHLAEMEIMAREVDLPGKPGQPIAEGLKQLSQSPPADPPAWLGEMLQQLRLVKALFGSIHLERGKPEKGENPFGPECPRPLLKELLETLEKHKPASWREPQEQIKKLLDDHTGGMLRFYDAVPEPNQAELLQTDIVNCHYSEYYKENSTYPPSDDQQPIPVTFLAVRPGARFIFPFAAQGWPQAAGRDREEKERLAALQGLEEKDLAPLVKKWLQTALGEWGIGAKTAAGYGYFNTGLDFQLPKGADNGTGVTTTEPGITPVKPPPYPSSTSPAAKLKGISRQHGETAWKIIAAGEHVEKVDGGPVSFREVNEPLPAREMSHGGKTLEVRYKNGSACCQVKVKLQGVHSEAEAQWVWETGILPELAKLASAAEP